MNAENYLYMVSKFLIVCQYVIICIYKIYRTLYPHPGYDHVTPIHIDWNNGHHSRYDTHGKWPAHVMILTAIDQLTSWYSQQLTSSRYDTHSNWPAHVAILTAIDQLTLWYSQQLASSRYDTHSNWPAYNAYSWILWLADCTRFHRSETNTCSLQSWSL